MKIIKGLLLSLLSLLLFFSLSLFGFAFTLRSTVLNPDFVTAEVNKLNIPVAVREVVDQTIKLPPEYAAFKEPVYAILVAQEPWIKQQVDSAIKVFYDFMLGKTDKMSLVIQLDPIKTSLKNDVKQAFLKQIPSQLSGLPPAMVDQYFEQMWQQFGGQIPSKIEFTDSQIPPDTMAKFLEAKKWIGYFQTGFWVSILFMIMLVAGIVLLQRDVRAITRGMGVTFITFGAFEYVGILVGKYFAPQGFSLPGMELPPSLQAWLSQLILDMVKPLEIFSLACLIGGIVLVVVSFVYPKKVEEAAA